MNEQWHDKLRNQLEDHQELAPEGLWEGIEKRVVPNNSMQLTNNKKRIWLISTAAVAAVVILILYLLPINTEPPILSTDFVENTSEIKKPIISIERKESKEFAELAKTNEAVESTELIEPIKTIELTESSSTTEPIERTRTDEFIGNNLNANLLITEIKTHSKDIEDNISEDIIIKEKQPSPIEDEATQLLAISNTRTHQKQSKWQTNLSMSNLPSNSTEVHTGFGTFAQQETVEEQYGVLSNYIDKDAYTNIDHDLPITFGLTLKYNLNNKWSVTSGLTYSLLTSKLRSGSGNYYYDDRQSLHYLGIPLGLAYNLWNNDNFSTYISGGGLVEKNVAGRLSSDYYIDDKLEINTTEKISSQPLQWSINSAIGFEYRISNYIGLYAEPGVAYYFKNNSNLETIYKDRPFNFNLRLGVRISFKD